MPNSGTTNASSGPFDLSQYESLFKSLQGVGTDAKAKSKADQDLAKLQGQLQQQLAQQQAQYAQQLAAQQAAAQLQQQQQQQQFTGPYQAAALTGQYNGAPTLQAVNQQQQYGLQQQQFGLQQQQFGLQQLQNQQQYGLAEKQFGLQDLQNQQQFGLSQKQLDLQTLNQQQQYGLQQQNLGLAQGQFGLQQLQNQQQYGLQQQNAYLQQQQYNLQHDVQLRAAALAELAQQQQNAVAQGNLELARQTQTQQLALQQQQQTDQTALARMQASGYMDNGSLTETARQARTQEALAAQQNAQNWQMQQQNLALAQGQFGLQQQQLDLSKLSQAQQNELASAGLYGTDNRGNYTLAGRQQNLDEAFRQAQLSGQLGNGGLTDASQQWRTQAGLQAAQMVAQAQQRPDDYFLAAALQRNGNVQDALGFLNAAGSGTSMGFRPAMTTMPQTGTVAGLSQLAPQQNVPVSVPNPQQNVPGLPPSQDAANAMLAPSLQAATNAHIQGTPAAFTAQMNQPQSDPVAAAASPAYVGGAESGGDRSLAASNGSVGAAYVPQGSSESGGDSRLGATNGSIGAGFNGQFQAAQAGMPDLAQQRLSAMQPTLAAGAHKMAPGTLEAMSGTERALFNSGLQASGMNPNDFETQYKRSRLQTNTSALAA